MLRRMVSMRSKVTATSTWLVCLKTIRSFHPTISRIYSIWMIIWLKMDSSSWHRHSPHRCVTFWSSQLERSTYSDHLQWSSKALPMSLWYRTFPNCPMVQIRQPQCFFTHHNSFFLWVLALVYEVFLAISLIRHSFGYKNKFYPRSSFWIRAVFERKWILEINCWICFGKLLGMLHFLGCYGLAGVAILLFFFPKE